MFIGVEEPAGVNSIVDVFVAGELGEVKLVGVEDISGEPVVLENTVVVKVV